jgi:hypothetical protein
MFASSRRGGIDAENNFRKDCRNYFGTNIILFVTDPAILRGCCPVEIRDFEGQQKNRLLSGFLQNKNLKTHPLFLLRFVVETIIN